MNKAKKLLTAALAAGALVASAIPIHQAVATSSPPSDAIQFTVAKTVRRLAEGAGVKVVVKITCAPGTYVDNVFVRITQARPGGGFVARASAYVSPAGVVCDSTEQRIPVVVLADSLSFVEGPAIAQTSVYACPDYTYYECQTFSETKTISIADPPVPAVVITPSGAVITEGDRGVSVANVVVELGSPAPQTVTIDWKTTDIPDNPAVAHPPSDYIAASGKLTFAPGETRKTIPIYVLGDNVPEEPLLYGEWGVVSFSNPSANAVLDTKSFFGVGLFIIIDDD